MGKAKGRQNKQPDFRIVDQVNDSEEDEEIDEDEAFNSDDERKYGAFFETQRAHGNCDDDDDGSSEEIASDDDSDEDDVDSKEGDGGQYMLDLLDRLDDDKDKPATEDLSTRRLASHVKESPYAASVLPAANLTLDSLMDDIKDTKGFGQVAKALNKVATGKATMVPLAKVKQDRLERRLNYQLQSKEMDQWIDAVQENRKAETLDFRNRDRVEVTRDVMIDSFVPSTDFERQLQIRLEQAGQKDEQAMLQAEEKAIADDLGNNMITLEEYERRRGQLAKMRSLMLSYEQKRHHMKKIKSKKYRRIRKRQRERAKETELTDAAEENPDIVRELEEKEEYERMKERMTLAHRNTSKWAKRVLKRGKNVDTDTRRALSAQLKRGDDLMQRMKSRMDRKDESDEDEDLAETARKVLEDKDDEEETTQANGLFKLAFMQKGIEKQRQRAKEEARQLLEELEEEDERDVEEDANEERERRKKPKKVKVASAEEMKHVLNNGNMATSSLAFGNSTALTVSGSISLDAGVPSSTTRETTLREHSAVIGAEPSLTAKSIAAPTNDQPKTIKNVPQNDALSRRGISGDDTTTSLLKDSSNSREEDLPAVATNSETEDANPWLAAAEASASKSKTNRHPVPTKSVVNVERAADILAAPSSQLAARGADSSANGAANSKQIVELTQDELVQRAFAGINDQDDFAAEKKRVEDEEDGVLAAAKKKGPDPTTVSGWGSWTGMGAPPPPPPSKRKLPKHLQAPSKKKAKRQRQDEHKPAVILREGRISKTANAHMIQQIPHPFSSREEYERSMMGGMGPEWSMSTKALTRPSVVTARGKIIRPLSMQAKRKKVVRPAAKF